MRAHLAATLCILLSVSLHAQAGSFAGTVVRDTLGHGIAHAEVQMPDAHQVTATDVGGNFAFSNIAPGRYAVVVRAVGFELLVDTIAIAAGQQFEADIVLHAAPVNLATVKTTAPTERRLPIGIQEMEERRKMHLGGYFVTDSMLRANDDRKLTYLLAEVPGLRQMVTQPPGLPSAGSAVYVLGGHGLTPCYVEVYVDGALYWRGPPSARNPPPDFNSLWANGYSGIEYYPSGATTPAEYNGTRAEDCGTMLLWTRRTP